MKLKIASLLMFLCQLFPAWGQPYVDIAKVYYSHTPVNDFENSSAGTRVKEFGLEITAPIPTNPDNIIITGLIYERTEVKLFESNNEDTLSIAGLKFGL